MLCVSETVSEKTGSRISVLFLSFQKIFVGQRTTYKMFSVNPGERYVAKVRCRSDHGTWSDWSPESFIKLRKGEDNCWG